MSDHQIRGGDAALQALRGEVRKLGARFDDTVLEATKSLYSPWLPSGPGGTSASSDVPYGTHARQRIDLYRPSEVRRSSPMLLYVPGGGFVGGDKDMGQGFYANVGHWFAAQGFLVAVMNYRLAPAFGWPVGSEDVAAAVRWLAEQAASLGGNADRLFAIGQSAGATHLAGALFDPAFGAAAERVRAAVLMSGVYQAQPPLRPGPMAYFGEDAATYARRSPAALAQPGHRPVLLTAAELDPPVMARQTLLLADRLTELDGQCPPLVLHRGHNHVSTVLSIGTPQDEVARLLLDFLHEHD